MSRTKRIRASAPRTLGDAVDRALGGRKHFVSHNCEIGLHGVCLGYYGGRTCECNCDHPLAKR